MIENPTCGAELRNKLTPLCNALSMWKLHLKNPNNKKHKVVFEMAMEMLDTSFADFDDLCKYLDRYEFNRDDYEKMIEEE